MMNVWFRRRTVGISYEDPGECGAHCTKGDQHPGRAADRVSEGAVITELGVENGAGDREGDRPRITRSIASTPEAMPTFAAGIAAHRRG